MLRTSITQKQYAISQRDDMVLELSPEYAKFEAATIIKTMLKTIKTKSNDSMDIETRAYFSKITDAVVRMVEEIN